jgi:hypothetical protein
MIRYGFFHPWTISASLFYNKSYDQPGVPNQSAPAAFLEQHRFFEAALQDHSLSSLGSLAVDIGGPKRWQAEQI